MAEQQVIDTERVQQAIIDLSEAFQPAIDTVVDALNAFAEYLNVKFAPALALIMQPLIRIFAERMEGESLVEWGNRLEQAGLLDEYEYRWMYQKECWRALFHSPVWLVKLIWVKVRGE